MEQALQFDCAGEALVGVLSHPSEPPAVGAETAVLVVVGGPQYRVGSHRQFTLLCRALAAGGYPALRFDCRGMGDSSGALLDFEATGTDIEAAIDALQRARPSVRHVVLWGLCDGASAALLYLHDRSDPRVAGLCLVNPWVRSPESLARTHVKHYYLSRLMQADFWRKLARGEVARKAFTELARNLRLAGRRGALASTTASTLPFQHRMARAWQAFAGPMLLVLSGDDYTAHEFREHVRGESGWRGALEQGNVTRLDVATANHTFSEPVDARKVEEATLEWLRQHAESPPTDNG
jgi:exosortase A-associated hydrolase 1